MDISVYKMKDIADGNVSKLIDQKSSFVLEGIDRLNMGEAVSALEKIIESKGLKCRVYTKGRSATFVGAVIPGPTVLVGWASAIGVGIHNVATWNPDYEIAKNLATGTLTVSYKK